MGKSKDGGGTDSSLGGRLKKLKTIKNTGTKGGKKGSIEKSGKAGGITRGK